MIPDRAPLPKTSCLTMLCYQQMPMIPKAPSNISQKKIVAECSSVGSSAGKECSELPKNKKAKKVVAPKQKSKDRNKQAGETLKAWNLIRIKQEVAELFKEGPLTVNMIQEKRNYSVRQVAGRKVMEWAKRGLIVEVDCKPTGAITGQRAKWWGLAK